MIWPLENWLRVGWRAAENFKKRDQSVSRGIGVFFTKDIGAAIVDKREGIGKIACAIIRNAGPGCIRPGAPLNHRIAMQTAKGDRPMFGMNGQPSEALRHSGRKVRCSECYRRGPAAPCSWGGRTLHLFAARESGDALMQ